MSRIGIGLFVSGLLSICSSGFSGASATPAAVTPEYGYKVVREFPHDSAAFTQGLAYRNGFLYEGTGLEGQSSIRKTRLETGEVVQRLNVPSQFFGEGIALLNDKLIELTWQSGVGFVYDAGSFREMKLFRYQGEGWGLASDGHQLYMSDGTDIIRVLDGNNYVEKRRFSVHEGQNPIRQLNELEWVDGQIFANIWHSDRIARISPTSGAVVGWINLEGLLSSVYKRDPEAVLNGIAYDSENKRLYVTGKRWPRVFEIRLVRK